MAAFCAPLGGCLAAFRMAPFVDLKEKNGITSGAPGSFSVGRNVGIDISLADPGTAEMERPETETDPVESHLHKLYSALVVESSTCLMSF